jgi:hypothetical protein
VHAQQLGARSDREVAPLPRGHPASARAPGGGTPLREARRRLARPVGRPTPPRTPEPALSPPPSNGIATSVTGPSLPRHPLGRGRPRRARRSRRSLHRFLRPAGTRTRTISRSFGGSTAHSGRRSRSPYLSPHGHERPPDRVRSGARWALSPGRTTARGTSLVVLRSGASRDPRCRSPRIAWAGRNAPEAMPTLRQGGRSRNRQGR